MTASTATMTRRGFLVAATAAAPAVLASCVGAPSNTPGTSGTGQAVNLTFEGRPVRCLVHRAGKPADAASTLTIVLLHGANTNASQWDDIGLAGVMANVDLSGPISSVVTIAPDIVDHSHGKTMVVETVAPFVARHWGQTNLAIGGISPVRRSRSMWPNRRARRFVPSVCTVRRWTWPTRFRHNHGSAGWMSVRLTVSSMQLHVQLPHCERAASSSSSITGRVATTVGTGEPICPSTWGSTWRSPTADRSD